MKVPAFPAVALGALLLGACAGVTRPDNEGRYVWQQDIVWHEDAIPFAAGAYIAWDMFKPGGKGLLYGTLSYIVTDPLAPNWEITETRLSDDTFALSLKMKRYRTGGDGEGMAVLRRRANELTRMLGYTDYHILDYTEGVESQTMGAERFGEGSIRLVRNR
jgi:hypothetical protein